MPQGKLRSKAKLPPAVAAAKNKRKPPQVLRKCAPQTPKKKTLVQEAQKIKKTITKNVNDAIVAELKSRATDSRARLSPKKKQPKTVKGKKAKK